MEEREYFDYSFDENEQIIEVGGVFHYIVTVNSLKELDEYANQYFTSTIDYDGWTDKGHTYKPVKILSVNKNCDGTYTAIFELDRVD